MEPLERKRQSEALTIRCELNIHRIQGRTVALLPPEASRRLPSRGVACIEGELEGQLVTLVLEPDGRGSHWFYLDVLEEYLKQHQSSVNGLELTLRPSERWPEANVPADVQNALNAHPLILTIWQDISPLARRDWLRWIGSTKNPDTRRRRISAALDKMEGGERRPCCFNRNSCCDPDVSKSGKLIIF